MGKNHTTLSNYFAKAKFDISYSKHIKIRFQELQDQFAKFKDKKVSEIIAELFPQNDPWATPFLEFLGDLDDENHNVSDI
jgi:DNA helicase II / ATP-dependent DNA helicase PcrA